MSKILIFRFWELETDHVINLEIQVLGLSRSHLFSKSSLFIFNHQFKRSPLFIYSKSRNYSKNTKFWTFFYHKWQIFRSKKWNSRSLKKKRRRKTAKRKRKRNRGGELIRSASRLPFSSDRRPINWSRFDLTTRARSTDAIELVSNFFELIIEIFLLIPQKTFFIKIAILLS